MVVTTYNNGATVTASTNVFDGLYRNTLLLGAQTTTAELNDPVLRAEEAWNIDTKIDDGKPAYGVLTPRARLTCTTATDAAGDSTLYSATYNLTDNTVSCAMLLRNTY